MRNCLVIPDASTLSFALSDFLDDEWRMPEVISREISTSHLLKDWSYRHITTMLHRLGSAAKESSEMYMSSR